MYVKETNQERKWTMSVLLAYQETEWLGMGWDLQLGQKVVKTEDRGECIWKKISVVEHVLKNI